METSNLFSNFWINSMSDKKINYSHASTMVDTCHYTNPQNVHAHAYSNHNVLLCRKPKTDCTERLLSHLYQDSEIPASRCPIKTYC